MRSLKAVLLLCLALTLTACSSPDSGGGGGDSEDYTFDVNGVQGQLRFEEVSAVSTQVAVSFEGGRFSNAPVRIQRSGESDVTLNPLDGNGSSTTTVNVPFDDISTSGTLIVGDPADPDFSFAYPPATP